MLNLAILSEWTSETINLVECERDCRAMHHFKSM